jgi:predicted GH43/DUF377 family glycosyl hydrolase
MGVLQHLQPVGGIHNTLFNIYYRAQGLDWIGHIDYAASADGVHWNRLRRPMLEPHDGTDSRGVEDQCATARDGVFYMCYTFPRKIRNRYTAFHSSASPSPKRHPSGIT